MQTNASSDPGGTRRMLAKLVAAVRGDKYMAGAYDNDAAPSAGQPAAAPAPHTSIVRTPTGDERAAIPARLDANRRVDDGWL